MNAPSDQSLISTRDASELSGYNSDYLGRLCRSGKIKATRDGRSWLINKKSLLVFVKAQEQAKKKFSTELSKEREREYARAQRELKRTDVDTPLPALSVTRENPRPRSVRSPYPILLQPATAVLVALMVVGSGLAIEAVPVRQAGTEVFLESVAFISKDGPSLVFADIGNGLAAGPTVGERGIALGISVRDLTRVFLAHAVATEIAVGDRIVRVTESILALHGAGTYAWAEQAPEVPAHVLTIAYRIGSGLTDQTQAASIASAGSYARIASYVPSYDIDPVFDRVEYAFDDVTLAIVGHTALVYDTSRETVSKTLALRIREPEMYLERRTLVASAHHSFFEQVALGTYTHIRGLFDTVGISIAQLFMRPEGEVQPLPPLAGTQGSDAGSATGSSSYSIIDRQEVIQNVHNYYSFFGGVTKEYLDERVGYLIGRQEEERADVVVSSGSSTVDLSAISGSTITNSTFEGTNVDTDALTLGTLTGPLQAINGAVSATTTISIAYGGTGLTSIPGYGQLLVGDGNGAYALIATSSLGVQSQLLGTQGQIAYFSGTNAVVGTSSLVIASGGNVGIGTTTPGTLLSVTGAGLFNGRITSLTGITAPTFTATSTAGASTFPYASTTALTVSGTQGLVVGSLNGPLHANNGVVSATTSIEAVYGGTGQSGYATGDILYADSDTSLARLPVSMNGLVLKLVGGLPSWQPDLTTGGGGGAGAWSTTTNDLAIYPSDTSDVVIIGAPATTTSNSMLEVFGRSYFSNTLRIGTTSGASMLSVQGNGLFSGNVSAANITATGTISVPNLTLNTLNGPLQANNGVVSATTSIGVLYGGTGLTTAPTYGQLLVGNSSAGYTLTATSSLGLQSTLVGTQGQVAYFSGTDTAVGTSSLFIATSGNVGIGTTTPVAEFGSKVLAIESSGERSMVVLSRFDATGVQALGALAFARSANETLSLIQGQLDNSTDSGILNFLTQPTGGTLTNRMRIDSTGNVGIGTTTPWGLLSVNPNGIAGPAFTIGSSTATQFFVGNLSGSGTRVGIGTPVPTSALDINTGAIGTNLSFSRAGTQKAQIGTAIAFGTAATDDLSIRSDGSNILFGFSGSELVRFTATNRIGVGTSSPNARLDIVGQNNVTIPLLQVSSLASFATTTHLVLTNAGNLGIGTSSPAAKLFIEGTVANSNTGQGIVLAASDSTSPTPRLALFPSGNGSAVIQTLQNGSLLFANSSGQFTMTIANSTTNVGIGTTSPYAKLSVAGETVAQNFTATSTTAVNTFPLVLFTSATTTNFGLNTETFTDLTGSGLQNVGGALTLNATGDWTGTFDGQEGSYYLANGFSTTSAQYFVHSSTTIPKTYATNIFTGANTFNAGLLSVGSTTINGNATTTGDFSAGGVFTARAGGNVGIGTTTPNNNLTVSGGKIFSNSVTNNSGIYISAAAGAYGLVQATNNADSSTNNLVLQQFGGNVGVGTTSPYRKFAVTGASAFTDGMDVYLSSTMSTFHSAANWNFPNLNLRREAANTNNVRFLSFLLDSDTANDTTQNSVWSLGLRTATTPAVGSTSDATTALQFFGPGSVLFSQVGSVGIGTTSPYARLSVVGQTVAEYFTATSTTASSTFMGALGVGTSSPTHKLTVANTAGTNTILNVDHTSVNGLSTLALTTGASSFGGGSGGGQVAIYDVGGVTATGLRGSIVMRRVNNSSSGSNSLGDYPMIFSTAAVDATAAERMRILGNGWVGIGTSSPYSKFSVWGDGTGTGQLFSLVSNASSTLIQVLDNGNVGIGTSTPNYRLQLAGETSQFPTALNIAPSTHASSRRAALSVDNWLIGQDGQGNGSKDFFIYDSDDNAQRLVIGSTGNITIGGSIASVAGITNSSTLTLSGTAANIALGSNFLSGDGGDEGIFVDSNGKVGIGSSTPIALLSINPTAANAEAALISVGSSTQTIFTLDDGGDLWTRTGRFIWTDASVPAAAGTICRATVFGVSWPTTCTSLSQYKLNQQDLSMGLDTIMQLRPVEFDWDETHGGQHDLGFIAQEVEAVNPLLAEYVQKEDGSYRLQGVKYQYLTSLLAKGIQELNLNVYTIASSSYASSTPKSRAFAEMFFERIIAWFADSANGVGTFFAGEIHTDRICVKKANGEDFCANGDELEALMAGVGASGSGGGSSPSEPPPSEDPPSDPPPDEESPPDDEAPEGDGGESPSDSGDTGGESGFAEGG